MKYLLFGTGDYYERYKKWFASDEVLALLDNSELKQGTYIDGIQVLSPAQGVVLNYDAIIILSFYVKAMKQQLVELGVKKEHIYHFYNLHNLLKEKGGIIKRSVKYYGNAEAVVNRLHGDRKKILLLSQELTLGGPSIALFHAAKALKKQGYDVVYASMIDGVLRDKLLENDISVVVDENIQVATMKEIEWVNSFSLIICNTLNFHVFLSERDSNIPIVWWLHDARFFYDGVNREVIEKINPDNMKMVSVGPIPRKAIEEFLPDMPCEELLYGVADVEKKQECKSKDDKIRFITIGFLEDIKGQDLLVQAVEMLPETIRRCTEFYIVGHNKTLFGEKVQKESAKFQEIEFLGNVERDKIHELLDLSDVLICPSRQDSMPTVAVEAMMHSVPCIVSDVTGTAAYIHNKEDGFIFESEKVQELAEKIEWCVRNRKELRHMGQKARRIYEKVFSMSVFEERLMEIVDEMLD